MNNNLHILTSNNIPAPVLASDDSQAIILLREAVYLLLEPLPVKLNNIKIYALKEDLLARGLNPEMIPAAIALIDYAQLVDLTVEYTRVTTW